MSENTVKVYVEFIKSFCINLKDKKIYDITLRDVEKYCEDILYRYQYSISSQRQFMSAIKKLLMYIPSIKIEPKLLESPTRSKLLPVVLSKVAG